MAKPRDKTGALEIEIASLRDLDLAELKRRWLSLFSQPVPRYFRREHLIRALAHRMQIEAYGNLKPSVRRRLRESDPALIKTVARAHIWFDDLVRGRITITEIASREGMKVSSVAKLLHLAFLAPDIIEAIVSGSQCVTAVAYHLIRSHLPVLWKDQRTSLIA